MLVGGRRENRALVALALAIARKPRPCVAAFKEALVIPGHLPWLKWYFDAV